MTNSILLAQSPTTTPTQQQPIIIPVPQYNPNNKPTTPTTPTTPTNKPTTTNNRPKPVTPPTPNYSPIKTVEVNPPVLSSKDLQSLKDFIIPLDVFYIKYQTYSKDSKNLIKYFNFSLPPAIETTQQYSAPGSFRGSSSVPDVKPGIPIRTTVKHRIIPFPGSPPVIQTIGVESSYITLVGAFIGNESISDKPILSPTTKSLDPIYFEPNSKNKSSYTQAKLFDEEVVQPGRNIRTVIKTAVSNKKTSTIEFAGSVNDFRFHSVRRNKSYYSITITITEFITKGK